MATFAIIKNETGISPVEEFRNADDATIAVSGFVSRYTPPLVASDYIAEDAASIVIPNGPWAWNHTSSAFVTNPFLWAASLGPYLTFRNALITDHLPGWSTTLSEYGKKNLVQHFVYPAAETDVALNALYPAALREKYSARTVAHLNEEGFSIQLSRTSGSGRYFDSGVNDASVAAVAEVTTDAVLS